MLGSSPASPPSPPPDEKGAGLALHAPPHPTVPPPVAVSPSSTLSLEKYGISQYPAFDCVVHEQVSERDTIAPVPPLSRPGAPRGSSRESSRTAGSVGAATDRNGQEAVEQWRRQRAASPRGPQTCAGDETTDRRHQTYEDAIDEESFWHEDRASSARIWKVLGYLTLLNFFLSLLNAVYALVLLFAAVLCVVLPPCRRISARQSVKHRLYRQLQLHLDFVQLELKFDPELEDCGLGRMATGHLFSPLISLPLSLMAAFVGFAWVYSELILGDKNDVAGLEYRAFLYVRDGWGRYVFWILQPGLGSSVGRDVEYLA